MNWLILVDAGVRTSSKESVRKGLDAALMLDDDIFRISSSLVGIEREKDFLKDLVAPSAVENVVRKPDTLW